MLCFQGGELDVVKLLDFGLVKELSVDADAQLTGEYTGFLVIIHSHAMKRSGRHHFRRINRHGDTPW